MEKRTILLTIGISLVALGVWRLKSTSAVPVTKTEDIDIKFSDFTDNENNVEAVSESSLYESILRSSGICIIGDSQIAGKLGDVFESTIGSINAEAQIGRLGIPGVTAKKLLQEVENKLKLNAVLDETSPNLVIIQLGDNGISSASAVQNLVEYIKARSTHPVKIFWVGAHTKTIPIDKNSKYVFTSADKKDDVRYITNYNNLVDTWNGNIQKGIENTEGNVFFINPTLLFPFKSYNMSQMSFDGVHIKEEPAKDFVEILLSRTV